MTPMFGTSKWRTSTVLNSTADSFADALFWPISISAKQT